MTKKLKLTKKEIEAIKKSHAVEIDLCTLEEMEETIELIKQTKEGKLSKSEEEDEF